MTPADELLAALAAAFFPEVAGRLLRRLSVPEAQNVALRGDALAPRSRSDRLAALAACLAGPGRRGAADATHAALAGERSTMARALRRLLPRAVVEPAGPRVHPLLGRALREAVSPKAPGP